MSNSSSSRIIQLIGLVIVLVLTVFMINQSIEQNEQATQQKLALMVRQMRDIQADQEQINRRISQYNDAIEALYNLMGLLENYDANKSEFQRAYNSHLKYTFQFIPRTGATQQITNSYMISDFEVRRLYEQLSRLYAAQQKAVEDQQGLVSFTQSDVWLEFFSKRVDLLTFDVLGDRSTFVPHFRNLIIHYIKEVEVTFLALQALDKEYSETVEILALELEIANVDLTEATAEEEILGDQ